MKKEAVFHLNTEEYVYPISRQELVFKIRTAKEDIKDAFLIHFDRSKPLETETVKLSSIVSDELFEYFEARVSFESTARYRKYFFKLIDFNDNEYFVSANGIKEFAPKDGCFEYLYANGTDIYSVPKWAEGCVYYQIFPERFCNGDKSLNPPETLPWGTPPTRENYMGGDLKGIIEKIPYLVELSIDCIYLNPIFKADFNHKYATTDYFNIDPQFGDNETFKELVNKCHQNGIKVVLDGVFNHSGVHFSQFEDVMEKQENSEYKDWFYIKKFPVEYSNECYECVGDYQWMPKLNTANPSVKKFVIYVMNFWIEKFGIDGWRLDVSDEVDPSLWEEARAELKRKYPNTVLIGETWGYGGKLLRGNQMDSVMNYMFRDAVWDYFGKEVIDAKEFKNRINHMIALHKTETNKVMFNLIDSHDTERFLFVAGSDEKKQNLAAVFQMMFIGSPSIYYGDEIGMNGDNDPDDRRCMEWEKTKDCEMLNRYRELIKIRKSHKAISEGSFEFIEADNEKDLIVFKRSNEDESVFVILHKGTDEVTTKIFGEEIKVEPLSAKIICK